MTQPQIVSRSRLTLRPRSKTPNKNMTEVALLDGTRILVSYRTPVAAWIPGKGFVRTSTRHSSTTSRHINAWLGQQINGEDASEVPQHDINALVPSGESLL